MRAPLPASLRLPRRSPCWPPHRQPSITPAPATPVDTEPTAPAPTSPTSRAHHPTAATAQQVHSPDKNTEQHTTYLRDTPLGGRRHCRYRMDVGVAAVCSGGSEVLKSPLFRDDEWAWG